MYKTIASILFCLCAQLCAEEEIRVLLSTDQSLTPLYLGKFQREECPLEESYLEELNSILRFDLNYNATTQVLSRTAEKEALIAKEFDAKTWKNFSASHVVKGEVSGKELTVMVLSPQTTALKRFEQIHLTGALTQDRRQIHKLADRIHKTLFNTDGIANTRILYCAQMKASSDNAPWISEIWECDWDGGNARQITREGSYSVTPVFVPANQNFATDRFLYVSYKIGQPKVFIASLKEGKGERFINLRGNQLLPAISPKRDKIAFICDAGGRADLFLQPFHPEKGELGKPVQLFSYPRSTQASPTFSPDGNKIAFVSDKDGSPRIYIIPAVYSTKRANPTLITKRNPESSCPSWSPDGKKLAYSAKTTGIRQIWIYNFDTKEETQLTHGPGNKENPVWAPDSLHLVFNSTDGNTSELYLVNLNQPEAIKITKGSGKKHYPAWGKR